MASPASFAGWEEDFEILKDLPRSYEVAGAICEEIGALQMQREYPEPQYTVVVGIAYSEGSRTLGELDLVIFDNNIQKVIKIGEVKCWKNVRDGLKKAREQRARFLKNLNNSKVVLSFRSTTTKETFDPHQFKYAKEFFSMAQSGSVNQGFDIELEYTLPELHRFRSEMLRCQNRGECARP